MKPATDTTTKAITTLTINAAPRTACRHGQSRVDDSSSRRHARSAPRGGIGRCETWEVPIDVLFASVPVAHLAPARAWYEQLLGRQPDITPNETEEMWRAADGAWLYVVVDARRAGHTLVNLAVADLDAEIAALRGRGLEVELVETVGAAGRKAWFHDPDGNAVVLIEVHGVAGNPARPSERGGA